ncbi:NADH dehydrogenase [Rosistilla oblonga]|uniref:FAD-dependent oxidoreductase n=1 Tax=Rosistilla oblonga TaxID=2527990 RepID=UPI001188813C|nr:FAD-dependent oxidoreductase [Rosistilla oblonga]QDV14173.1 NADH dehydrogenase [Rosistilla oblonga]
MSPKVDEASTKNIVLLGMGHTNADIAHRWQEDPIPGCRLTCISKFPTATYSGMLPGTLGQQFRDDEMRIDLASLADRAGADFILADTSGLDLNAGQIHFHDHPSIPFDLLSIGVGSMPAGWAEYSDSPLMVPIKPMQTFLQRLDARLQTASRSAGGPMRVAIVGGGVASVEIACCLQARAGKSDNNRPLAIEIFTSSEHVADGMTTRSIDRIERLLERRGINVQRSRRVVEVGETDLATDDGQRHVADCVIWATGAAAPPVLQQLGLQTDDRGFIATAATLQSLTDPRIFAVGDAGTIVASPSPKAGVYAVRQCPVLWDNLNASIAGQPLDEFDPQSDFLKILNTGDGKALLEFGRWTAHSRWCWWLKTWIDRRFVQKFQRPD